MTQNSERYCSCGGTRHKDADMCDHCEAIAQATIPNMQSPIIDQRPTVKETKDVKVTIEFKVTPLKEA